MKRAIAVLVVVPLIGCAASEEEMKQYYDAIRTSNDAVIASINQQGADNTKSRQSMMVHYTNATLEASKTPDHMDDVLIAFAWGYQSAQPLDITVPNLKHPAPPVTDVDRVRAWTPIVGMAVPFLYPLAYGWASGSGDTTYYAQDQGKIEVSSRNAGSYNTAGGDQTITATTQECLTCGEDGEPGGDIPQIGDPEECTASPPGGFSPSGTPLACEGCSCGSYFAGECDCVATTQ